MKRLARSLTALFVLVFTLPAPSRSDDPLPFREGADPDPTVPTPESILGISIGERPMRQPEVIRYFEELAESSPRVELREYGQTHEGRRLFYAVIARPEYLARSEELRAQRDLFADPRLDVDASLAEEMPAVAWMGYSIHGDELSSTDAAVQLAYELAAGRDDAVTEILQNAIVLVDPLQNPDGRERYLSQLEFLNGVVPNPDPASLNHTAFWPWGRGNHYLFDLNRDWFVQMHPESRGKVAVIREWKPQLVVDAHEMGTASTYLFPPPREPFNPHMHDWFWDWLNRFADDQAAAFDQFGWSYYTREWNEEWFPGYGSSWPAFLGAVGILYEQSRTSGRVVKRPDGTMVDFREAVHHQLVSSLVNLTTLARNRRDLLLDFRASRARAVERGGRGPMRAILLVPRPNRERLDRLAANLVNQGVELLRAAEPVSASDLHDPWSEEASSRTLPEGTRLIRLDQPLEPLIRTTMDFHTQMADSFLASEREYLETRNETRLYEATGWSLPLAYGLEAYWTGRIPGGRWEPEGEPRHAEGALAGDWPAYGMVADVAQENVLAAAAKLLESGLSLRAAEEPFRMDGVEYGAGSLLLRRETNPDSLAEVVQRVAEETGVTFRTAHSARSEAGPDLGGDKFVPLATPRIAIAAGSPVSTSQYGAIWHLFDNEMRIRVSSLDVARIGTTDLSRYNVLILPPAWGGAGTYRRALGSAATESVRRWVEEGGTLIGIDAGAAFLADTTAAFSQVRLRRQTTQDHPAPERGVPYRIARHLHMSEAMGEDESEDVPALPPNFGVPGAGEPVLGPGAILLAGDAGQRWKAAARGAAREGKTNAETAAEEVDAETRERIDERLRRFRPRGPILRVDLDPRRWLAFGMEEKTTAFLYSPYAYLAREPVETVGRFADYDALHVSGLLWPEAAGRWARTAYLTRERRGRGQVILFAENPVFRGYWLGTRRLLQNAAILGPGLGAARTGPY